MSFELGICTLQAEQTRQILLASNVQLPTSGDTRMSSVSYTHGVQSSLMQLITAINQLIN